MELHQLSDAVTRQELKPKEKFDVREVAELLRISERAVQKKIIKEKWITEDVPHPGPTGVKKYIPLTSLPALVQLKYCRENNLYQNKDQKYFEEESLDEIPEKAREIALTKNDWIISWLDFRKKSKLPKHKADLKFIHQYKSNPNDPIYKRLNGKGSIKTLYRDWKLLEENGNDWRVLVPGFSYGKAGSIVCAKEAEALLKYIKYPTKLKISEIVRNAVDELQADGFVNIRHPRVYEHWINEWKNKNFDEWTLHREGQKALNDKVSYYTRRDKELLEVGDMIVIDGHTLNFEIQSPYPPYKPKRMTLILTYDYRSDMPLGWEIMPSENKYAIASAVRRALIFLAYSCGLENNALKGRVVNIDNGRANKSKYLLGTKDCWYHGDFKKDGVTGLFQKVFEKVQIAKPYHGQTKTIERFFGTFSEMERLAITYSGTSIADKAPRMMRNEKYHKAIYEKMTKGVSMGVEQAHYAISKWFDNYAARPHQDGYFKGHTPKDLFFESLEKVKRMPDFESRLLGKEHLNYLMLEERITTLYRRGIRFGGREYFDPALYSFEKGKDRIEFRIKFDRESPESILVFDEKDNFICTATEKKLLHPLAKFYGSPDEIQEYQDQLKMQSEMKRLTVDSFQTHFTTEVMPLLPAAIKQIENREEAKQLKRGNAVIKKAVGYDGLDFSCDDEIKKIDNELDLNP